MCLAQGHNAESLVRLELATLQSRVKHPTTEPLGSLLDSDGKLNKNLLCERK